MNRQSIPTCLGNDFRFNIVKTTHTTLSNRFEMGNKLYEVDFQLKYTVKFGIYLKFE